ncbi:MAG: hypothetical protein HC942_13015 [Microcoleus sp. SU_5_6]|nr:hypothetical protein [Microcoleus sp. SU_5_6]NJL68557.1 hypothetical protein [Microcoleus sp. SM1_3_4]
MLIPFSSCLRLERLTSLSKENKPTKLPKIIRIIGIEKRRGKGNRFIRRRKKEEGRRKND